MYNLASETEIQYITCDCADPEHLIKIELETIDNCKVLSFIFLLNNKLSFFQRIKIGFKYLFGLKYIGEMHEVVINKEDAKRINLIIEDYLK